MPAMVQRIEPIDAVVEKFYRTHQSGGPSKYSDLMVTSLDAKGDPGCNLNALINFMDKTAFGVEQMLAARKRKCIEIDVWQAFGAYCQAIQKVEYVYIDQNSIFDRMASLRKPNCKGRAKGFVQLLAVCGVPLGDLALVGIGGDGGDFEGKKIMRRDEATVNPQSVLELLTAPQDPSPNAVTVRLQNNVLDVSRTTREPFANHYCAKVTGRGKYKFWDPLFHHAYVNGMSDYFLTYEERSRENLSPSGPKCYVDVDDEKNRLYLFKPNQVSSTFADSNALRQVQAEMAGLQSDPSMYLIIDRKDWSNRKEEKILGHPWIVTQFFRDKPASFSGQI